MFVLGHIVVAHVLKPSSPFRIITRLYAASWIAGVITAIVVDGGSSLTLEPLLDALTAALVSPSLFVLYMPFYYTFAASLTVQTVLRLHDAGANGVRVADLYAAYGSDQTLGARIESMVASGNLVREGPVAYRLTTKGRVVAHVFSRVKDLWVLGPGG